MKGEDIDAYIIEIEELIQLAEYRFDVPQTIETFTDGLPTGCNATAGVIVRRAFGSSFSVE